MQFLLLQTFAWMVLAGLLGAILGCMARRMFGARDYEEAVATRAVAAPAGVVAAAPVAPVAARVAPKGPMVEASKAPAPVAPPAAAPASASAYTYPVTTIGIPRGNPELVQPQIQTINLPAAAGGGAGSVAAAVSIRQPAPVAERVYPVTTIGIPPGYVDIAARAASVAAPATADPTRFDRALNGPAGQPRPEPLRPELARNTASVAPAAPVVPAAPVAPAAPVVTAPVEEPPIAAPAAPAAPRVGAIAPLAPRAPINPSAAKPVPPGAPKPVTQAAPVATDKPAEPRPAPSIAATVEPRVGVVGNAPIESKPAGIAAGAPPIGPIASRPAGIAPPDAVTKVAPAPVAAAEPAKPVAPKPETKDVPFEPVVAGGAALAAIAARAASASAAAAAAATASAPSPVATPAKPAAAESVAATGAGDDLMRIRSIDATLQSRLKAAGVLRFSEIARWTPADVGRISQTLGLTGRIEQENWIEQAQILATGGETEYSRRRLRGEIATTSAAPVAAASAAPVVAPTVPVTPTAPVGAPAAASVAPAAPVKASSDTSTAAATAAAAAMASAAINRATANIEPSMPSKLVDAIRENLAKPVAAAASAVAAPVVAAVTAAVAPAADSAPAAEAGRAARPDLAGLRSVRSEALRDGPPAGARGSNEDLKRVRGIGVLIEKKLNSLGVHSYEQIANWTSADIDRVSQILDFKGRIERENWVEQARILASGGQTEFSKRVDRGEA